MQAALEVICDLYFIGEADEAFSGERNHSESCSQLVVKVRPDPGPQTTTAVPLPPYGAALLLSVHFTASRPQILERFLSIRPAEIHGNAALGFFSLYLVGRLISKSETNTTSC